MSKLEDFDLDQLLLNLHSELSQVINVAKSIDGKNEIILKNLKFKMGQKVEPETEIQENILNADRYPNNESWEVELNYKAGDYSPSNMPKQLETSDVLVKRLASEPLSIVQGISSYWQEHWHKFGVSQVSDLFEFDTNRFWFDNNIPTQMMSQYSIVQNLAFDFLPVTQQQYHKIPLKLFWIKSPQNLHKLMSNLTVQQVFALQSQVWRLGTILDLIFLKSQNLKLFAPS